MQSAPLSPDSFVTLLDFAGLCVIHQHITSVFIGYIGTDSIGSLIKRFAAKSRGKKMVKPIINVRRSSICWRGRRELITDVRKPEIMVMTSIVGLGNCYWLLDHPRKLVTLNPKLKSTGAGRYQLLSRWWDTPWRQPERLLEKVGRCGIAAD